MTQALAYLLIIVSNDKENKTGVINDPLGQPTVPAGSDRRLILKFWDGRTDGRTLSVKIVITTGLVDQQDKSRKFSNTPGTTFHSFKSVVISGRMNEQRV